MHKLFLERALLPDGWATDVSVTVADGAFSSVTAGTDADPAAQRVRGFALPGTGNVHSHTFQRGFAGLTERRGEEEDHFWTWREAMYAFLSVLTPEDVQAIAAMAFVEMIESGFTAVAEFHYLHHGRDGEPYADPAELSRRIVAAAAETGIGLALLPVFYAHGGIGGRAPALGQRRFICDLDLFARLHAGAADAIRTLPLGGIGLAPHSIRAVTRDELRSLLADHPTGPVHLHIAEQQLEVEECLAATGQRPVDWLLGAVEIDPRWCLIHATHMEPEETGRLAATGAVAGLCPITEGNLGDGIFPGVDFVRHGGHFGIGTDSNVMISLRDELRTLCYSQRLRDRARNRLATPLRSSGRSIFEAAARGGAQALRMPIGAIAPGMRADLVVLDHNHVALAGRQDDTVLDTWIYATAGSPIEAVMVAGDWLVTEGRHRARDRVSAAFRTVMQRLGSSIPGTLQPGQLRAI